MNISTYFIILLSCMSAVPAGILYCLAMRDQFRPNSGKRFLFSLLAAGVLLPVSAYAAWRFSLTPNALFLPIVIAGFILLQINLTSHFSKSLAVYLHVCAIMSILADFAIGFDARVHPNSGANIYSLSHSLFQIIFFCGFVLLAARPVWKYGSALVDSLESHHIWNTTMFLSGIYWAVSLLIRPIHYSTLYMNKIFMAFWAVCIFLLISYLTLAVVFFFIVSGVQAESENRERISIQKLRESHYLNQQQFMNERARMQHEFKHTIRTLESLIHAGDLSIVQQFLEDYLASMPKNDTVVFCSNSTANALLNYYRKLADSYSIKLDWRIAVPDIITVSDEDFRSVLGNLLENAVFACADVMPMEARYISLVIEIDDAYNLTITSKNSFDGNIKKRNGRYLSARKPGYGAGLSSIMTTAKEYGGKVKFSNTKNEFTATVSLPQ